nr:hypothetical protein BaRGS_009385 [Batillaria attramentaria]
MGRPKKADSASACRPERPLSSSSRRKYSGSYTYRPGSGAERLHSDAGSNAGVEKGSGPHPLEHHFSVEPVYDIADEFLKAVSMHIDDQQCGDIKVSRQSLWFKPRGSDVRRLLEVVVVVVVEVVASC